GRGEEGAVLEAGGGGVVEEGARGERDLRAVDRALLVGYRALDGARPEELQGEEPLPVVARGHDHRAFDVVGVARERAEHLDPGRARLEVAEGRDAVAVRRGRRAAAGVRA